MKSNTELATALANLGKTLPAAGTCRICDTQPTRFSIPAPAPHLEAGTPGGEETASGPARFDHPFPRQGLLFVMTL